MTGSMLSTPGAPVRFGHGVVGFAAGAAEVQELLRGIADRRSLPSSADELLKVERLRENRSHYVIKCRVRRRGGRVSPAHTSLSRAMRTRTSCCVSWSSGAAGMLSSSSPRAGRPSACSSACWSLQALPRCACSATPLSPGCRRASTSPGLAAAFAALFGAVYFRHPPARGE